MKNFFGTAEGRRLTPIKAFFICHSERNRGICRLVHWRKKAYSSAWRSQVYPEPVEGLGMTTYWF
jgi:hypothetical protein